MAKTSKQKEDAVIKKLKETPGKKKFDLHYWADFIEMRCLFNPDGIFSKDDFLDCYHENKDLLPKDYDDDNSSNESVAAKNDRDENFAKDCFKILKSRIDFFKGHYPFLISNDSRYIQKKKALSWRNNCYIFLLFSSSLKYLEDYQSILTSSFEVFSLHVLKKVLPATAEAHLFGASNSIIKNRRYTGHVWDKLNQLKSDLNEKVIKVKKRDFTKTNSGDSGIDFVAWVSNGDTQSNIISYAGQAACTANWHAKKYSSSASALSSKLIISVPPINVVFIPFSVRTINGQWHEPQEIGDCVLIDRQRLLYHFENDKKEFENLPCDKLIKILLKIKKSALN